MVSAAPVETRPRTPLISFCTVQLRILCATRSLATLCLSTTSGPDPGELPASGALWCSAMPPSPESGRVNNNDRIVTLGLYKTFFSVGYQHFLRMFWPV